MLPCEGADGDETEYGEYDTVSPLPPLSLSLRMLLLLRFDFRALKPTHALPVAWTAIMGCWTDVRP